MAEAHRNEAEPPVQLTGSSPPTGAGPAFKPVATSATDAPKPAAASWLDDVGDADFDWRTHPEAALMNMAATAGDLAEREYQAYGQIPQTGGVEEVKALRALTDGLAKACESLAAMPARTPEGLSCKATVIREIYSHDTNFSSEPGPATLLHSFIKDAVWIGTHSRFQLSLLDGLPSAPPEHQPREGWTFRHLMQKWAASAIECDHFTTMAMECEGRTARVDMPEALYRQPADFNQAYSLAVVERNGRKAYAAEDIIDRLRTMSGHARVDEIVTAYDAWRADVAAAQKASGFTALEALGEEAEAFNAELRQRIFETPVSGLDGLLHKALVYSWHLNGDQRGGLAEVQEELRNRVNDSGWNFDTTLEMAIIRDLVAIATACGMNVQAIAARGFDTIDLARKKDRRALEAYREWLFFEGKLLGLEMYPELGRDGARHIPVHTAAETFHFPAGGDWREVEPPSTRAERMLAILGIDWRKADPGEQQTADRSAA